LRLAFLVSTVIYFTDGSPIHVDLS